MITYKKSGVDIDKANDFVKWIKKKVPSIGFFSGFYKINKTQFVVATTDGVGTKLKIAQLVNKHNTIGIDLVAMNVNDIVVCGAKPLFFLDYIAVGKLNLRLMKDIMHGIIEGCKQSNCQLLGGETAEMPGMYKEDEYDLAGFACGIVEKKHVITGKNVQVGDIIVGLYSSGLHSNGFSLVRKVFDEKLQKKYKDDLLKPTKIYVDIILSLLEKFEPNKDIKAIANITGGGFYDNIIRVIPERKKAVIFKKSFRPPKIFELIQKNGKIEDKEMFRTFNMGIGMVLIVNKNIVNDLIKYLDGNGLIIGEVVGSKVSVVEVL